MRYSASGCDSLSPKDEFSQTDRATQSRDAVVVAASIAPLEVSTTDSEAESCPSMHTAIFRWSLARPTSTAHARVASVSETVTTSRKPDSTNASRSDDKLPLDVT